MPEWLELGWRVGGVLLVAGAVYGGIRADLRRLHERSRNAATLAERAHDKIDGHIVDHARGGHGF